jgi:hypothetical protein
MPRFRKRNTAVYAALFGSAIYILYSLFFESRSPGTCESSTEHRRIVTGLDNGFGPGTKSRLSWGEQVPETTVVTGMPFKEFCLAASSFDLTIALPVEWPGYTVFDNLYAYKGNYLAVSDQKTMHTITKFAISHDGQPRFQVLDGFHARYELGSSGIILFGTTVSNGIHTSADRGR